MDLCENTPSTRRLLDGVLTQVYGYSKTFGRSPGCNEATAEMIRGALPGYRVDWSDEGY